MATSGASALPRCATSSTGRAGAKRVVEEVLGDEFEGVLVSDFYGAYNVYQGPHQRCWTHLLRDIHQLKEQHPQDLVLARWAHAVVREVYDHAQAYPEPGPNLPETVRRAQRVEQQQRYQRWLWSICKPYLGSDAPMRVPCQWSCSPSSPSPGPARTTTRRSVVCARRW